jgi:hypothetical protein
MGWLCGRWEKSACREGKITQQEVKSVLLDFVAMVVF